MSLFPYERRCRRLPGSQTQPGRPVSGGGWVDGNLGEDVLLKVDAVAAALIEHAAGGVGLELLTYGARQAAGPVFGGDESRSGERMHKRWRFGSGTRRCSRRIY